VGDSGAIGVATPEGRRAGRHDRYALLLAAGPCSLVALGAYLVTLAPSVSAKPDVSDSGELAAAAYTFGVAHPTGYPLYMLLGGAVSHLPLGEPAHALNVFSALCAALAVAGVAALCLAVAGPDGTAATPDPGARLPSGGARPGGAVTTAGRPRRLGGIVGGGAAGLLFGAQPSLWLQATNTETRTLAAALLTASLLALTRGLTALDQRLLLGACALAGLALADHLMCLALLPALAAGLLFGPLDSGGAGRRQRGWPIARGLLALCPGLLLYLYLPLRTAAGPALNWGDPRTPARFLWMVTGAQYRPLMGLALADLPAALAGRLSALAADLGAPTLIAGCVGLLWLARRRPHVALVWALVLAAGLGQSALYGAAAAPQYLIPCQIVLAALAGCVVSAAVAASVAQWARVGLSLGTVLIVLATLGHQVARWSAVPPEQGQQTVRTTLATLRDLPRDSILFATGDEDTFPLWYAQFALRVRPDVAVVNLNLLAWQWYAGHLRARYPMLRWGTTAWTDADGDLTLAGGAGRALARQQALVQANLRRVAIYWTGPDVVSNVCGVEEQGNLYRCVPL